MKLSIIFALLLVIFVTYSSGQACPGSPRTPRCTGAVNIGRAGAGCVARPKWQYNARTRQCVEFRYLGCGGNDNRWCSRASCEMSCRR